MNVSPAPSRIRLGFLLIGDGQWRGGLNYQRTLLEAISKSMSHTVEARVFVTDDQFDLASEMFGDLLEVPPTVDARVAGAGAGRRALLAAITGHDCALQDMMQEHSVDVVFETARFYGRSFQVPCLSWIPDFQHRYLPDLFPRTNWWKREIGFQAQTKFGQNRILLLSSETARTDCEKFYPASRGKTRVVRFTPQVDVEVARARADAAITRHGLPARYFYLPNHFWAHKNHTVVLEALHVLAERGTLTDFPPIVMSGPTNDSRSATLFDQSMARAEREGLTPWFRHLGMISFDDVLALNAGALALINPSLFEGWASSVEEAKALGTPTVLSDLPVHREQAPDAMFFSPEDPMSLADILQRACQENWCRQDTQTLEAAGKVRRTQFVSAFLTAIQDSHASKTRETTGA